MVNKHKLIFPEAEGRYWVLYWIGKIYFENKTYKVDLHFVNQREASIKVHDFSDKTFTQRVNTSSLVYYQIGVIFDSIESTIIDANQLKQPFKNFDIKTKDQFFAAKGKFPLAGHSQFPNVKGLEKEKLEFLKFQRNNVTIGNTKTNFMILISPYTLLDYFFFRSSRIINKVLSGQVLLSFNFNEMKVIYDETKNKKIAKLPYDNTRIDKKNALAIAPYLFLKDGLGIKMLNSVYSSLHKCFTNYKGEAENNGAYISLHFNTDNYYLKLEHLSFEDNTINLTNNDSDVNNEILLASKILDFNFRGDKVFSIDEILLIPLFPDRNKSNKNSDDKTVTNNPEPSLEEITVLDLYPNKSVSSRGSVKSKIIKNNQINPFNIGVKIEPLTGEMGKYFNEPSDNEINGLSTEINWDIQIDELKILQQEAELTYSKTTSIDNIQYFQKIVEELKNIAKERDKEENILINDDPLEIGREKYPYEKMGSKRYFIDIVEIKENGAFLYVVEFGTGFIGVFNKINNGKLNNQFLLSLLNQFIDKDKVVPSSNEKIKKDKAVRFWTILYTEYQDYFLKQDVEIKQAIKHLRQSKSNDKSVFKKTAENIMKRFKT